MKLFSHSYGGQKSQLKVQSCLASGESTLIFLLYLLALSSQGLSSVVHGQNSGSSSSSYKGTIPIRLNSHHYNFIQLNSLLAQLVKNLPIMLQMWVQSLGGEDPLEKEIATHSSILVWKIPWTEEPGRLQSLGLQELDITECLKHHHLPPDGPFLQMQSPWQLGI